MSWTHQWDAAVAASQDEMSLGYLRSGVYPPHWIALLNRLRELEPIGSILEVGCSTGYLLELLRKEGIRFASFCGVETNGDALAVAWNRDVQATWLPSLEGLFKDGVPRRRFDIVIDGACIMHVEDWKEHARKLGLLARRELIFSRLAVASKTERRNTFGHGKEFSAWCFDVSDIVAEVGSDGAPEASQCERNGIMETQVWVPRRRRAVTYYDRNYLRKGQLMTASHGGQVIRYETDGEDVETMWRLGPQRIRTEMQRAQSDVTYVDADYYFFGPIDEYYHEVGDAPAAIIPHASTTRAEASALGYGTGKNYFIGTLHEAHAGLYGTYNVGMVYFDNTVQGREILDWWVDRCAEWCHARVEDGKYGDQKYLDEFPAMGAKVITNPGVGMGPWSSKALKMTRDGDRIMIGKPGQEPRRLLAYHFSTFHPDRWIDPVYGDCEWARPAYEEYAKAWAR